MVIFKVSKEEQEELKKLILKNKPHLSDRTCSDYLSKWYRIKRYFQKYFKTKKPLDEPYEKFSEFLGFYKEGTRMNYLSALICMAKVLNKSDKEEQFKTQLKSIVDGKKPEDKATQDKITKLAENWTTLKELKKCYRRHLQKVKLLNLYKRPTIDDEDFNILKNALIVGLYLSDISKREDTLNPPRRLEYANLQISRGFSPAVPEDKTANYLMCENGRSKKYFLLNNYKTYKKYGSIRIPINKDLNRLINYYLKYHEGTYLFQQKKADLPISCNALGQKLSKILKKDFPDKNITLNTIRHIYTSQLYNGEYLGKKKLDDISLLMGNSVSIQMSNYAHAINKSGDLK